MKYEFDVEFDVCKPHNLITEVLIYFLLQIPVTYPTTAPEIALPELDGKTAKMYRGGKICLSDHFKPLWARNVPKFGIGHAMALGVRFKCHFMIYLLYNKFILARTMVSS